MSEYEVEKLKHEIGLKILMNKAVAQDKSNNTNQPVPTLNGGGGNNQDILQVRNFLQSAQLGAFAANIEA